MSKKSRHTEDQERQRLEGLRILARIIARHYLDHPQTYPAAADTHVAADENRPAGEQQDAA